MLAGLDLGVLAEDFPDIDVSPEPDHDAVRLQCRRPGCPGWSTVVRVTLFESASDAWCAVVDAMTTHRGRGCAPACRDGVPGFARPPAVRRAATRHVSIVRLPDGGPLA